MTVTFLPWHQSARSVHSMPQFFRSRPIIFLRKIFVVPFGAPQELGGPVSLNPRFLRHGAIHICSVQGYKPTHVYIVIATKPVHRLQIRPTVHNKRASATIPPSFIQVRAVVWEGTTDKQTAIANIHFVSAMPHAYTG